MISIEEIRRQIRDFVKIRKIRITSINGLKYEGTIITFSDTSVTISNPKGYVPNEIDYDLIAKIEEIKK